MNPSATGTSAGHEPAPFEREKERTEKANGAWYSEGGRTNKWRGAEKGEGIEERYAESWLESRGCETEGGKRREGRKREKRGEGRTLPRRRRLRPVIYIESYLHLNVFIFNARPRNRSLAPKSSRSDLVSAARIRVPSRSRALNAAEDRGVERGGKKGREKRDAHARTFEPGKFHRRPLGGPYGLISPRRTASPFLSPPFLRPARPLRPQEARTQPIPPRRGSRGV